jgi:hypothetical protein
MRLKYFKYDVRNGLRKVKTRTAVVLSTIALTFSGGLGLSLNLLNNAGAASGTVIYNNIPDVLPGNLPSQAFEATSTSEFGGQVTFAGTTRNDPTVTVAMSSWGCETGHWNSGDCSTAPGATFSQPITLNIYNVGSGGSVGSQVTTVTQTFNIPYRPSVDSTNCIGGDAGKWFNTADDTCYNGMLTPVSFTLTGVTLPDTAIVSVAYNTTHYGANPYGDDEECFSSPAGCGYDSLNVAVTAPPTVGVNAQDGDAYLNSSWTGAYCDNGSAGTGTFRLDAGCWAGNQPAIKVETAALGKALGSATGGLNLGNPRQHISFNAFDYGVNSTNDYGNVDYQNFTYPGGLHYTSKVTCATIKGSDATIMFQIPQGYPGLSGLYVVANIHDGGSPGTKGDTYGHTATDNLTTAKSWCESGSSAPVGTYTVTAGNAVVHKN